MQICFCSATQRHSLEQGDYPDAAVHTDLGSSPVHVAIAHPAPPAFPDMFDVDKSFKGSLSQALAAARASNAAKPHGLATVLIGTSQREYQVSNPHLILTQVSYSSPNPHPQSS